MEIHRGWDYQPGWVKHTSMFSWADTLSVHYHCLWHNYLLMHCHLLYNNLGSCLGRQVWIKLILPYHTSYVFVSHFWFRYRALLLKRNYGLVVSKAYFASGLVVMLIVTSMFQTTRWAWFASWVHHDSSFIHYSFVVVTKWLKTSLLEYVCMHPICKWRFVNSLPPSFLRILDQNWAI